MPITRPCPRCQEPMEIPQPVPEKVQCAKCGVVVKFAKAPAPVPAPAPTPVPLSVEKPAEFDLIRHEASGLFWFILLQQAKHTGSRLGNADLPRAAPAMGGE